MKQDFNRLGPKTTSCLIMGVVNITPDSFSDGGCYLDPSRALDHIAQLVEDGADIIDIGAESSRPGAGMISVKDERARLFPILDRLCQARLPVAISVDTNKPEIMLELADFGVRYINNIRGLTSPECLEALAVRGHHYIAMHMHGEPATMQAQALGRDAAWHTFHDFCEGAVEMLREAGFPDDKIWLDPGIGFGKTDAGNLALLQYCMQNVAHQRFAVGISRKSMLGRLLNIEDALQRDKPSKMLELSLMLAGVSMIRTHEVRTLASMRQLLASP